VRNSTVFGQILVCATLGFTLAATAARAQDEAPKEEPPPGAAKNFGPRKGAQQAQGGGEQGPQAEIVAKHGKWEVQCATLEDGKGGAIRSCGMVQVAKTDKSDQVVLSVIVSKLKQGGKSQTIMRLLAPIGVYLPTGVAVEIDGAALPNRLPFTRCTPRVCEAFGEASGETIKKFSKGTSATFYLYDRPGNGFPMKISLEGFAAGLGTLDKQK
jgi:invasion protein IalB